MLSRRPTPYNFDYTVVLHSHPSAIKTFISLNCSHYNRPDRIRQGLLSIFYQNGVWFLCNCVSSGMVSQKFSYILQATPPHCLLLCAMEARDLLDSLKQKRMWKTCLCFSHPFLIYSSDLSEASYTAGFQMRWLYLPSTAARIHPKISQEITSPIPTVSIMSGIGSSTPYA